MCVIPVRMISQHVTNISNITTFRHGSLSIPMRVHPKLPVPLNKNLKIEVKTKSTLGQ